MKNLQIFPFERNQYYYGKLMTYQDMTSEQKYMNDKRRLINRFLHGTGVASGLQVVRLDDRTLSVEAGLALDGTGREIVLDEPQVVMLDQLEGYGDLAGGEEPAYAYMCLAYDEQGICPAGARAGGSGDRETFEKYRECGRLYLTTVPPEDGIDTVSGLAWQTAVLFENSDLAVSCRIPEFVRSGDSFEMVLRIEAKRALPETEVRLGASLAAVSCQGKERLDIVWSGSLQAAGDIAEQRETLTAYSIEDGFGTITVRRRELKVTAAGREHYPAEDLAGKIRITNRDAYHQMLESWYDDSMNRVLGPGGPGGIYLAKLYLRYAGEEIRIGRIEQLPFGQRVYNSFVNMGLTEQLIREVEALKCESHREKGGAGKKPPANDKLKMASGVYEFSLGIGAKSGERFFSGEIVHGLGLGRLKVSLSLETEEFQYFGSEEIFEEMKVRAELAARANSERGSFVIGVRLLEATSVEKIRIRWSAVLLPEDKGQSSEKYIRVLPDKPEMRCMQSRYFRAETENLHGATVLWEVCTPGGGTVTPDGQYTAPDTEGIYEVRAFCQEDPKIRSSVFVIVRE